MEPPLQVERRSLLQDARRSRALRAGQRAHPVLRQEQRERLCHRHRRQIERGVHPRHRILGHDERAEDAGGRPGRLLLQPLQQRWRTDHAGLHLQQRGRVTKFFMGLNDTYEQTRRHILMLKPIPTIEEASNIVAQDERQRNLKPVVQTDAVTLQTTGPTAAYIDSMELAAAYNAYRPRGNRPLCTHCGQLGHTEAKCFKLHGYPPGYRPPSSGYQGQSYGAPQQSFTPRGQHNYTPRSQIPPKTVAQMSSHVDSIPYIPPPVVLATSLDVNQLNSSQLQSIIQQLQSRVQIPDTVAACTTASITEKGVMDPQSSSGISLNISSNLRYQNHIFTFHHQCLSTLYNSLPKQSWIIDSGATSHVCADLSKFQEVFDASNLTVSLPNGTTFPILHTGTIRLSDSLVLYDVLHVPSFHFNLISVHALLHHNNCSAHFYPDHCFLQDLSQASMIGKGDVFNSLYILDLSASSPTVLPAGFCGSLSVNSTTWHNRLGHPSAAKLQVLSDALSLPSSSLSCHEHCSVCPLAKQKRLSFPFHNHKSDTPFALLHLDIWGTFSIESVAGHKYFLTIVDDATRVTWVYMLRNKNDVSHVFPAFITLIQTQYNARLKAIRTDNAPEITIQ